MGKQNLQIGLVSPLAPSAREQCVATVGHYLAEAAEHGVEIVCFPETYLPGYRNDDFPDTPPPDQAAQESALDQIQTLVRQHRVALILPAEWQGPDGMLNVAFVINADGSIQGRQTKNQIPAEEEPYYVCGTSRQMFTVNEVPFGVVICHEGSRYPESVRWAARRGASVVFHPHMTGSNGRGRVPRFWGDPEAEYYEKAMVTRAVENAIYFASVNFALSHQESATSLIDPEGRCIDHIPYGEAGMLIADLDLRRATRWPAVRLSPERYAD